MNHQFHSIFCCAWQYWEILGGYHIWRCWDQHLCFMYAKLACILLFHYTVVSLVHAMPLCPCMKQLCEPSYYPKIVLLSQVYSQWHITIMNSIKWLSEAEYNLTIYNNKALLLKLWPQLSYGNINSTISVTLNESFKKWSNELKEEKFHWACSSFLGTVIYYVTYKGISLDLMRHAFKAVAFLLKFT
jgi:hypothetical protein